MNKDKLTASETTFSLKGGDPWIMAQWCLDNLVRPDWNYWIDANTLTYHFTFLSEDSANWFALTWT